MKPRTEAFFERPTDLLARKLGQSGSAHDALMRDIRQLSRDRIDHASNRTIVKDRDVCPQLYLVESGWVFRSRALASGRRQIVNYTLPGDFLCVDSAIFKASGFDLTTRTPVSLLRIDAPAPPALFSQYPGLAAGLTWSIAQEESILAERTVSLGRRDSLEKLAHALCELQARLSRIGLMRGQVIECPMNQEDFADMLGISVIHINRTFRRLSEEKAVEYRKGQIEILDAKRLAELAFFEPGYLRFD